MNTLKWLTIGILTLMLAGSASAGTLTRGLEQQMSTLRGDDVIKVLVVMADQADIQTLNWDLHDNKATMAVRHQTVLQTLQDTAKGSQNSLLADLESAKAGGEILGFASHWIVNSVVVTGTVDSIRQLATRSDVETIEADLIVELIEPVPSEKRVNPAKDNRGVGITPGVVAVGARRVWNELGIDGTGVVVGELDTGVAGNHVALQARWRGNYAPAEECWLDAAGLGHNTPTDTHGHGSHVMGTITGLADDDTIGVAPGALWIASNIINSSTGGGFDNGVIASLEFMADPDGDPLTTDDMPVVVQNSWGVNENFDGYYDCDSRWWDAIDNCEAAGVCLTWSAGNEGPDGSSMRSPADRAASPGNCFSVGSTLTSPPYSISSFSSRGPSGCGGEFAMKPEICAPGSDIYSVNNTGGYTYKSGTSMAGPHLAGVVALMRASNPDVDVITIKQVLMDTAIDLGTPGEDNNYGHGFVDAYEAVLAVMGGIGTVEGTVVDNQTGLPIEGAIIRRIDGYNTAVTDENGFYSMTLPAETIAFNAEAFGYEDVWFQVHVPEDGTYVANVAMNPLPAAWVSGVVYNSSYDPVFGATVTVLDTPVGPVTTNADGYYELVLPIGPGFFYDLKATAQGLGTEVHTVEVNGSVTHNFVLPDWFGEDFESGDFSLNDWIMGGHAPWTITTDAYEGQYAARSADITDQQTSEMEITLEVTATSDISFWSKVDSEATYDFLYFYIDGTQRAEWEGDEPWSLFSASVDPGTHTFKWVYYKDYSVSSGDDAAWVDFIEFPVAAVPAITVDVEEFVEHLVPVGGRGLHTMTIGNVGAGPLTWDIALFQTWENRTALANQVPHLELDKEESDPRAGMDPAAGWDGPDAFGYHWEDNNAPGGPAFDWIDIADSGVLLPGEDEAAYGPFDLGFDFTFYGNSYDSVRISSNGFVSFSSIPSVAWTNQGIPDAEQPNNLIAAFWDDLNPERSGDIYYLADAANDRFIVQYEDVYSWANGSQETFQIILNADGSVLCQYEVVENPNSCTAGIENQAGDDGLLVAFNADYLASGMAIGFYPPAPLTWVTATPLAGQTGPGGETEVDVNFYGEDMMPGVYTAELWINSNDPNTPNILLPVTLTVDGSSAAGDLLPSVVRFEGAVPNPFNPATDIKFSLPREASVQLDLYDVSGRLVRSLMSENLAAGQHEARWNGQDDAGRSVASGTYFARLVVDGVNSVKAMVLVR